MTNSKKVILMVVVVILLSAITTLVLATNDGLEIITNTNLDGALNISDTNSTTTNTAINDIGNIATPTNNLIQNTNTNANTSTYNNTSNLPQTGAGDYTMILIIGLFAVSAVYAYKKIVDYKNV